MSGEILLREPKPCASNDTREKDGAASERMVCERRWRLLLL